MIYLGEKEALLIQAARRGDRRAFEELVKIHERKVYSLAYRMLGSIEDAEDVLQETFLAFYRHLKSFRGSSRLSTYLHRMALNFSLIHLRRRKSRREKYQVDLEQALERHDPTAFTLERLVDSEARALLNRFLQELGDKERVAVVLHDIEGLPNAEASRIMGITLAAFKSRLHRGRDSLRIKLLPYIKKA